MHNINYDYLRPKKAEALKLWHTEQFPKRQALDIWYGKNATILPLRKIEEDHILFGRGGVVDSDGNYVKLSSLKDRIQYCYPHDSTDYHDKKVVYCGYLIDHWGHFLVEAVARLWYFLEQDATVDKYVFFLKEGEEREITGNYKEFFELLGIWNKLELINKPTTYREVIVPELGFQCRSYYSTKYLDIFDTVANNVKNNTAYKYPNAIYFSRSQLIKNSYFEFGFEALDNFFHLNGYTILFPEKIKLSQMICYIRNADVVATVSGSLAHNMLFSSNKQKLIICERCVINNDFQANVNIMRELQTTYIDSNMPIYTVSMCGPFIMGFNDNMKRFAVEHNLLFPAQKYYSEKYLKKCFVKYMKTYIDMYCFQWYMDEWYVPFADYLLEAYQAGLKYWGAYIKRQKPIFWYQNFEWHYIKQFIKRVMNINSQ